MQAKQLAFEQLMDVRAARVSVGNSVAECYAALGVRVHSLWQFIRRGVRRLHRDPQGQSATARFTRPPPSDREREPVEIQIRTHEMHANSERGVAAHWRYKEGGRTDQAYDRKINQLHELRWRPTEGGDSVARFSRPHARGFVSGPDLRDLAQG